MSKKSTLKEIENYINNEIKEGRVNIGFEDVNRNVAPLTYIYKRMVSGFMLIKSDYGTKIKTEPVFLCGENNDVSYDLEEYEKVIGTLPALNCFAVFCLVPKNVSFSKLKSKSYPVKSVLLGYEYPNSEHPEWIGEHKKEFINAFDYDEEKDQEDFDDDEIEEDSDFEEIDENEKAEKIKKFLNKYKKMESGGE